jgi:ketosteroid isomerase-like protein
MRQALFAIGLLALGMTTTPVAAEPVTPAPVVAAERTFAADGYATGIKASFLKHSAADAILIQPAPVNARESLRASPDGKPDDPKLEWWPLWAGMAKSGDLGFTTGPFAYAGKRRGHYFTVWKKQLNGEWKWIFDGGTASSADGAAGPGGAVGFLAMSDVPPIDSGLALAAVFAEEDRLAGAGRTDLKSAYLRVFACDGRMQGSARPPATDCGAAADELAFRPAAAALKTLGGEASMAGDLAWTYGSIDWSQDGQAQKGHYVRVWQRRAEGWRIVFDELLPPPAAPPPLN